MNVLKTTLLATAIALGFGSATVSAEEAATVGQAIDDAAITAAVKTKLLADERTDGFDINVDTTNGVVTLRGGADSEAAKVAAATLAAGTDGVVRVDNQLTVAAEGTEKREEANTATASGALRESVDDASAQLAAGSAEAAAETREAAREVKAETKAAANEAAAETREASAETRAAANEAAAETEAVAKEVAADTAEVARDVAAGTQAVAEEVADETAAAIDEANLDEGVDAAAEQIDDAWITTKVKSQLLADADVNGMSIDVDTTANVVTLTGTAQSSSARAKAIELASTTRGVRTVVADQLIVKQ